MDLSIQGSRLVGQSQNESRNYIHRTSQGFCGSLTTFSSWQLDIFKAWINAQNFRRGGLQDVSLKAVYVTCGPDSFMGLVHRWCWGVHDDSLGFLGLGFIWL